METKTKTPTAPLNLGPKLTNFTLQRPSNNKLVCLFVRKHNLMPSAAHLVPNKQQTNKHVHTYMVALAWPKIPYNLI